MRTTFKLVILLFSILGLGLASWGAEPMQQGELIFAPEHWHNHGSCIVECPNGDLLVCWYHGSGERTADDVAILGARRKKHGRNWSAPFVMADTPGYPDTNPAMFIDPSKRLWLLWPTILAHTWESALMKFCIASKYENSGPPHWETTEVMHLSPGTNFQSQVTSWLEEMAPERASGVPAERVAAWIHRERERAGDELSRRLGWMTRVHPYVLENRRVLVPLYSDGFNFSLVAMSDDWGKSWFTSGPMLGFGNVQPSLVRKRDGTLVAFMRDNGPAPKRAQVSESTDAGLTWSRAKDSDQPNPGSGLEAIVLSDGLWLLINNDLERGRHSLAVSLSDDEGKTWRWKRHLERDTDADLKEGAGSYHYPSVIQSRDGTIHASYSFHCRAREVKRDASGKPASESIKHAQFNEAWVRAGD